MLDKIGSGWDKLLGEELKKEYFKNLRTFLETEYKQNEVYPAKDDIFNAYQLTSPESIKCVIIGQDPYHEPGQAHGLAFSVRKGCRRPPSLVNIFKELESDLGISPPPDGNGDLTEWSKSGVMLLNAVLTVRAHEAGSHRGKGWEIFTDNTIKTINKSQNPIAFILWGKNAQEKSKFIDTSRHLVIIGAHPSPLSAHRGFFGGKYFSRVNEFLISQGRSPVNWKLENEKNENEIK